MPLGELLWAVLALSPWLLMLAQGILCSSPGQEESISAEPEYGIPAERLLLPSAGQETTLQSFSPPGIAGEWPECAWHDP